MDSAPTQRTYLVIGGCGFLGRYIVDGLVNRGERNVKVFDIRKTFENDKVEFILGDITKIDDVKKACTGVYAVIHTASPVHDAPAHLLEKINITGTKNLIEACQAVGVKQIIYTSSASVVFSGQDLKEADETTPYCAKHMDHYNYTKQVAEEMVLASNGKSGVMTCALRPSGIFGPRDAQAWPGFMGVAKQKILGRYPKSILQIGDGSNKFDWTYVDNIAHAHILASDKMVSGSAIGGQAYFITNGEPTPFWDMPKYIFRNFGYPEPYIKLPYTMMYAIATLVAIIVWILSPIVKLHPDFTPLRIANAGANRYFSIKKAQRDLGYKPIVSLEEGKKRSLAFFKAEREAGRF